MGDKSTILRFLLVGVGNTLVGLISIFTAKGLFGMGDVAANAFGYSIGITVSFTLNRAWTFRHSGSIANTLMLFLLVQAIAYLINLICVLFLIDQGVNGYLAQTLGIAPYTVVSYIGSRYLAFAEPKVTVQSAGPTETPLGKPDKEATCEIRRN